MAVRNGDIAVLWRRLLCEGPIRVVSGLTRRRWLDLEGHKRLGYRAFDRTAPRSTPSVRRLASHPPEAAREVCLIDHSTAEGNLTQSS